MNFHAALRSAGVRFKTKGPETILNCPFCVGRHESPDTKFRLAVNIVKNAGNCLNCGWVAREHAMETVIEVLHIDAGREIRSWLLDEPEVDNPEKKEIETGPPEGFIALGAFNTQEKNPDDPVTWAIRYLGKRGFSWDDIVDQRIGLCLRGNYRYRIIFPIFKYTPPYSGGTFSVSEPHPERLRWDGFVARALGAGEPKYLNSAGPKPLYVAGGPRWRSKIQEVDKRLILSEGVIKAHALQKNASHSAALLGHTLSDRRRSEIPAGKPVVIFPDPDRAGLYGTLKVARELSSQCEVWIPQNLPKRQADEYSYEDRDRILSQLELFTPFVELKIEQRIAELRWM